MTSENLPPLGSISASSSLSQPVDNTRRRLPHSDAEKLDTVCNYMRSELRWGVSDFIKALASSKGSNSARRKSAFVTAAYKDEEVLKSYFGDADELWDGARQSIIETLDLDNNELRPLSLPVVNLLGLLQADSMA